jgi:SAM-dependent methyltransferase
MSEGYAAADVDFEAIYQGKSPMGQNVPWVIGRPQPSVVARADAGQFSGAVLDAGCGVGDNAIFLASRGYRVTAIDVSPTAIERASQRAQAEGVEVDFVVGDAIALDGFDGRFDTVLDSALYHGLGDDERRRYIAALHRATKPGAVLHLFCVSEGLPPLFPPSFGVREHDLRHTLSPKWTITSLEPGTWYTAVYPDMLRTALSGFPPAKNAPAVSADALQLDEDGRIRLPMWYVAAQRMD